MAKQNSKASVITQTEEHPAATLNYEGGLSYELDAKTRLYTRVATSLVGEPKFYQDGADHDAEILSDVRAVAELDPEWILKLAAYARQVLHLRSVPTLLLVEASLIPACKPWVRQYSPQIVRRADELTEVVAYFTRRVGDIGSRGQSGGAYAFPNSLKRALADAFSRFDEYQLVKYDREGQVKLRDVLRVIDRKVGYPVGQAMRDYLVQGKLDEGALPLTAAKNRLMRQEQFGEEARALAQAAHATWEVVISKFGGSKETWEAVIPQMGYMALLRNLRNFLKAGVDLKPVLARITDSNEVQRSKQLPFRFFSAFREVEQMKSCEGRHATLEAVCQALELSVVNLPKLPGVTLIAADNSGSMEATLSQRGSVRYADVANLMGAIAHSLCEEAVVGAFGTDFAPVELDSTESTIGRMHRFAKADTRGMSTNAYRVMQYLRGAWRQARSDSWCGATYERQDFKARTEPIRVDRIILLSDMQCYDDRYFYGGESLAAELRRYRAAVNPHVYVYSVDLAGYGTSQFPPDEPRVAMLAGWSERILEFISLFEGDRTQAVERIGSWQPES